MSVNEGLKYDQDKLRYDLIPAEVLVALAETLTFGAKKYEPNSWKYVKPTDRYKAAKLRHHVARELGEIYDPESGLPHKYHELTNLAFEVFFEVEQLKKSKESGDGK